MSPAGATEGPGWQSVTIFTLVARTTCPLYPLSRPPKPRCVVYYSLQDNDQPFFVVDVGDIVYKVKLWKLKMPRVEPFYAVKCNGEPAVLELLAGLGLGFDCASKAEIDCVRALGVAPGRIIYANPCKTRSFIKHAAALGVDLMTFDNELELHKVHELYPAARLVLRLRVDDSGSVCQLGLKFGCELDDAPRLLARARSLGLAVVGVRSVLCLHSFSSGGTFAKLKVLGCSRCACEQRVALLVQCPCGRAAVVV